MTGFGRGLADIDPSWLAVLKWKTLDSGFLGFTTFAPVKLRSECEEDYSLEGLKATISGDKKTTKGVIVCIESAPPTERLFGRRVGDVSQRTPLMHSPVQMAGNSYVLPPLTGIWVVGVPPGDMFEYLPGKWINQQLITVKVVYRVPPAVAVAAEARARGSPGSPAAESRRATKFVHL